MNLTRIPATRTGTNPLPRQTRPCLAQRIARAACQALLVLGALLYLTSPQVLAREKRPPAPNANEVAAKKGDLLELRGQIGALRKEVSAAEGKRADVADQLKDVEQEISQTQRELHNLTAQRDKLQGTLKDLGAQSRDLESRLLSQQAQLEKLVYRQYLDGNPDSLRLLLNGDEPNQTARDLYYLGAIGRARSALLHEIENTLQQKKALTATTRERADNLAAIEARQKEQHGKLVAQRQQRKDVLDRISAKIAEQRREIGNLQRDEKRLAQLIKRLAKVIAAKPVPHKEARVANERRAPGGKASAPEISNETTPEATPAGSFARLKGALRLPARGVIGNRFGAARQEGSTRKGLFIRAGSGSEVRAIAAGQVVFADWMRGFGNLLVVDHGGSYLSIYGNNEALLKQVGESVRGGDVIASVGNSGGNPESGLYFELRYQGQPLDPLKWVSLK